MHRRTFLVSILTVATILTAGYSSLGPQTEHTGPVVGTDNNHRGRGRYLKLEAGDDGNLATVGVDPASGPLPRPLAVSISHTDDTELRSLTQRFTASDGDGSPPKLSLHGPLEGGHEPHPSVSLFRDDTTIVFEVHRFGELTDEIAFISFAVTERPDSAHRLVVNSIVELVGTGTFEHTHVLDGKLTFNFFAGADAGDGTAETPDSSGELDTDSPRV